MKALEGEMVATSAKAQMLGGVLRTVLNVGLTLLISTLVSLPNIIKNISDSIKQERQEAADSAKQQIDDINDLRTQYYELSEQVKTDSSVKEQLTTVTKQLLKRLGLEKQAIEDLSDDYERLNGNINEATISSLQEAESSLRATIADNSSVEDKNFSTNGGYIVSDNFGKKTIQTVSALKEYREIVNDLQKEFSNFNFQDSMITFDVSNVDTIKQSYQDVSDLLAYMNEEYGDNTQQSILYHSLAAIQTELKTDIDKYDTAVSNLNDNIAQQTILSGLIGREIPKTTEEFNKFKQELIDSIYYINDEGDTVTKFAGVTQDNMKLAENAILSFLSTMPEFKKFFEIGSDDGNNGSSLQSKLSGLNSELESLKEAADSAFSNQSTLQSAFDKIQEGASLSADEVRKLVEICPEIATEFKKTVDGYTISSDALIKANDNIIQSTKESVETQIKVYQEVIDKYNEIKNAASMPEGARQDRLKALGISEEEIKNAEQQINQLRLILGMLGITLGEDAFQVEKLKEKYEELSKVGSSLSSKMKSLSSVFKEQKENGELSADTILSIIENGYAAALMYDKETGKVKLNEQAYLNLAKAELTAYEADLQTQISDAELQLLDAKRSIVSNLGWSYLDTAEAALKLAEAEATINNNPELIENLKGQLLAVQELKNGLGSVVTGDYGSSGGGSSSDPTKDAYTEKQKELKHLLEMEKITQAQYYEMLFGSDEYKALLADRAKYRDELNSIDEEYYKYQQNLYKENADKQFDDLEDQRKRGIITAEQYAQGLHDLGQELYGEDSIYGGTEFAIKALEELDKKVKETSEDIYDEFKEGLSADGDKTLFNVLSDAEELWNRTNELFAGDLTSIKSNAKDIFGTVSSALEDALKKGIITVDGYESLLRSWANTLQVTEADITEALADTYEYRANALQKANDGSLASERKYIADMKSLNFSTYGDENSDFYDPTTYASNLRDITDHQLDVLEKALNNGEISVQEYANSVVEIFKDADVLGADYVSEKLDDIDKVRAEREKTYWEQQKELMEDYYDKQIKEIEDTQKAKEKENKLEELHLKLIKARQTLEEAKNNRNQLVFHDGTFEYLADQDAVMSAEEDVANTLKEIENEKLQAQIDLLEEQKDAALGFYDQILDEIDFYLDKTLPLSESDQEELAKIRNSDYAQYARDKRDGNLIANPDNEKNAEDALNQTNTAEETKQSVSDIAKNVLDIAKVVANGFNFENLVRALGGNPTAEAVKNFQDSYNATLVGKQIVPSTLPSNITNNSSTTNNNAKTIINIEKIFENLYMPEGTTKEQVEAFFKHLNSAILQRIPQALIEVSK